MQIPVLLEPIPGRGYRARGAEPFALEADGSTRDEALRRLSELIASRIEQGAELVTIDVPASDNPWVSCAGMFKDSALYDEWQAEIAARREGPD